MIPLVFAPHLRWLWPMLGLLGIACGRLSAQGDATNVRSAVTAEVLSALWATDSIVLPDGNVISRHVVGFLGPEYQRFELRMTSVARASDSLPVFAFAGKTRFRDTVRAVSGLAAIAEAAVYPAKNGLQTGYLTARLRFTDSDSGYFEGELTTYFVQEQETFRYDALLYQHPTFSNNGCVGLYRRRGLPVLPCHWGDFRVPDCGDLDVGAAQFVPNARYYPFGWERYVQAWLSDAGSPEAVAARAAEEAPWWK